MFPCLHHVTLLKINRLLHCNQSNFLKYNMISFLCLKLFSSFQSPNGKNMKSLPLGPQATCKKKRSLAFLYFPLLQPHFTHILCSNHVKVLAALKRAKLLASVPLHIHLSLLRNALPPCSSNKCLFFDIKSN